MKLEILSAALVAFSVLGCRETLHLMEKTEHFEEGEWVFDGTGCLDAISNDGDQSGWETGIAPGGNEGEYIHEKGHSKDGVITMELSTEQHTEVLVFDREFLRSSEERVVLMTAPSGTEYRYTFWGGTECESEFPTRD